MWHINPCCTIFEGVHFIPTTSFLTMTRFYLGTLLVAIVATTLSSPSTVATPLEATDAGDEFLAELDQVEDSGKKPRVDRELNYWWNTDDGNWHPPTKRPTKRPTKKPWGWKPPTKKPTKKPWGWNGWR